MACEIVHLARIDKLASPLEKIALPDELRWQQFYATLFFVAGVSLVSSQNAFTFVIGLLIVPHRNLKLLIGVIAGALT
jgi:hypothetical protein